MSPVRVWPGDHHPTGWGGQLVCNGCGHGFSCWHPGPDPAQPWQTILDRIVWFARMNGWSVEPPLCNECKAESG